jgi:hypothetical protein
VTLTANRRRSRRQLTALALLAVKTLREMLRALDEYKKAAPAVQVRP